MKSILLASVCFLLGSYAFAQQTVLLSESFETDGEGTRYTTNTFQDATYSCRFFKRANSSSCFGSTVQLPTGNGSYFWAGEYINAPMATGSRPDGLISLFPVAVSGNADLQVKLLIGTGSNSFESADYLNLQYSSDGITYTTFASYRGKANRLQQDTDLNGSGDYNPGFSGTLLEVSHSLPSSFTGGTLYIRLQLHTDEANEEIALDNIRLYGATNQAPTNITLSSSSQQENTASGTTIGTFTTTDPNTTQSYTYSLVTGTGSTDNAKFQIAGSLLKNAVLLDYDTQSSYSIRVRTTDNGTPALSYEKVFTVTVTNVDEAPVINAQAFSVTENVAAGTVVGTVTAYDPEGDNFTYSIISGNTNSHFAINSATGLLTTTTNAINYESLSAYNLTVRATQSGNKRTNATITISVNNVNEAPTALSVSATSVYEDQPAGTVVGTFSTTEPDNGQTHTYTLVSGTGSTGNSSFTISGNQLQTAAVFNDQTQASYTIRVRATDSGSPQLFFERTFTITVTNLATMTYSSVAVSQNNKGTVAGAKGQQILAVKITATASGQTYSALTASQFSFSATGTTTVSDIDNARLFYTGTSSEFDTLTQISVSGVPQNGAFSFSTNQELLNGTNYFWLAYDVNQGADEGNLLDAALTGLVVGSPRTVSAGNPNGSREVVTLGNRAVSSVSFDGVDDYIDAGASTALIMDNTFTIEAWIRPSSSITSGYAGFLGYDPGNAAQRSPSMWVYDQRKLMVGFGTGTSWNSLQTTTDVLNLNEWNHVATTFDGTTLRVYANGLEVLSTTEFAGQTPYAQPVRNIGRVDSYFKGRIDEVTIWDRTLSADEIQSGRHLVRTGAELGLAAYWQFNDNTTTEADKIGGTQATLVNGTARIASTAPVSEGVSKRYIISHDQLVEFEGTGVTLDFKDVSGMFEVVISRLQGTALGTAMLDSFPEVSLLSQGQYWVINKYGNGTFGSATTLTYTLGAGVISAAEAENPSTLKLYKRTSNSDASWAHTNTAISANQATGAVTFDNITGFSQSLIGSTGSPNPLPVLLVSYSAKRVNQDALLEWATAAESENSGFEVQVSADGKVFKKLGEVKTGASASSRTQHYSYLDTRPNKSGNYYYKLLQHDTNGQVNNLGVRVVSFDAVTSRIVAQPNPFSTEVEVLIESLSHQDAFVSLTDAMGKEVFTQSLKIIEGHNKLSVATSGLRNGVYILTVKMPQQVTSLRLVKI